MRKPLSNHSGVAGDDAYDVGEVGEWFYEGGEVLWFDFVGGLGSR
jgi:hypothetical protein